MTLKSFSTALALLLTLALSPTWAQKVIPPEAAGGGPVQLVNSNPSKTELELKRKERLGDKERLTKEDERKLSKLLERQGKPPALSEFERHVTRLAASAKSERDNEGEPVAQVRRFGADLLWEAERSVESLDASAVPDDYVIGPGDEIVVDLWGSVAANLRLDVSRQGAISIPRVGAVNVAGLRFADLPNAIRVRVSEQFRGFELAVGLGQLRQMRVFVTGFVARPGVHLVSGAASLTQVLAAAGGPTAVGSLRQVQLRRRGQMVETLDFYDLFLRGQLAQDRRLQPGDVLHVPASGIQVGIIGAVQQQAVFELKPDETAADALRMAGGLAPVANADRAAVVGLGRNAPVRELLLAEAAKTALRAGEVLRVYSLTELTLPVLATHSRVRVEGEVLRPGDYVLPPGASLRDALAAAGGTSANASLFGTELSRESLRRQQLEAYERTLRDMEAEFTRMAVTRKERLGPITDENPNAPAIHSRLIERLRQAQPSGRLVLGMKPDDRNLPNLAVEDGDRLYIPSRHAAVSVYGSVFNTGSFALQPGRTLGDYLAQAGGPRRGADSEAVFVLRSDGSVVSNQLGSRWWRSSDAVQSLPALPGDTVFVPEEMDKVRWSTALKDWAQILSQFGLGAVALKNLSN